MELILEGRGLSVGWPGRGAVLEGIDITIRAGEVLCILGPNGVGKSTLLACLCGLLTPDAGSLRLAGRPMETLSRAAIACQLAFVPQSQSSVFDFTLRSFVEFGRAAHLGLFQSPGAGDRERVSAVLDLLGLAPLADKRISEVSGGERQMATIARALVQEPRLVILDEPASHLDFGNQARLLRVISRLRADGLSVVFTTHLPDHAFAVADRTMALSRSAPPATGPTAEILTEAVLSRAYDIAVTLTRTPAGMHASPAFDPG